MREPVAMTSWSKWILSPEASSTSEVAGSIRMTVSTTRSTFASSNDRSGRWSFSGRSLPIAMYMYPGWYACCPVASTTVTLASPLAMRRLSFRATRFAVRVPPTPPPRTTTRCTGLPGLRDDDLVVSVLRLDAHERVAGLLDPLRDVGLASLVGRPDGDRVADLGLLDRADELHQRAGAEAAAGIDGSGDGRSHAEDRSFQVSGAGAPERMGRSRCAPLRAPDGSDEQRGAALGHEADHRCGADRLGHALDQVLWLQAEHVHGHLAGDELDPHR